MNYSYKVKSKANFRQTIEKTKENLNKQGFGVLTEINVQETLKKKLELDYDDYVILGACNPPFAYEALQAEKEIGLFLPCNVLVYRENDEIFVSAILPSVAMNMIENSELKGLALQVEEKLKNVLDNVA